MSAVDSTKLYMTNFFEVDCIGDIVEIVLAGADRVVDMVAAVEVVADAFVVVAVEISIGNQYFPFPIL